MSFVFVFSTFKNILRLYHFVSCIVFVIWLIFLCSFPLPRQNAEKMSELSEFIRTYDVVCDRLEAMTEAYEKLAEEHRKSEATNAELRETVNRLIEERDKMLSMNTELSKAVTQALSNASEERLRFLNQFAGLRMKTESE